MMKVKTFNLFSLFLLPSTVLAEDTLNSVEGKQFVEATSQVIDPSYRDAKDTILPQLSLEAHKARQLELETQRLEKQQKLLLTEEEIQQINQAKERIEQLVGNNQLLLLSDVAKLYLHNDFQPMWQNEQAEKLFIKEYAVFAASGVSTKAVIALQQILASAKGGLLRDILLTDSLLDFLYYTSGVTKSANQWLYRLGSYRSQSPSLLEQEAWLNAVKLADTEQFIQNLQPKNHIYQETLEKLFALSTEKLLTKELIEEDKNIKNKKNIKNAETSKVLLTKLALNAQRLRIIPDFNNGLFVNIPSYQLYYFRDGQLILQSRVIVGKNERRTPVMLSKLSNVVVNPPWNIPPTILTKDFIPKMAKDPSYAERGGFEVFDSSGNKINVYDVDWESYAESRSFPYRIRQKAGDDSALGRFKFNMPSSDAIYLHDTPNRSLFNKNKRALSSGCVRIAKADELATILLSEAGWSLERKQKVLESQRTTSARILSDNPVYLYYVTTWVEDGKIHTLPDIYQYDQKLKQVELDWEEVNKHI